MNSGELAAHWGRNYRIALLYQRDGELCAICNDKMLFEIAHSHSPLYATIDHILPASKGGANCLKNFRLTCAECNNERGNVYNKKMGGVHVLDSSKFALGDSIHKSVRDRLHLILQSN